MNLSRLFPHMRESLQEDFNRLTGTVLDCPFHVHVSGGSRERPDMFWVVFSTSKHKNHHMPDQSPDVIASARCRLMSEPYGNQIMMEVTIKEKKQEFGWPARDSSKMIGDSEPHDWYNQRWRYEPFVMECAAAPLWNLLERSVDFEALGLKIAKEVTEK